MRQYKNQDGKKVVEIDSLAFLYERKGYSWLRRHWLNRKYRRAILKADVVEAADSKVAGDIRKYYFYSPERHRQHPELRTEGDEKSGL